MNSLRTFFVPFKTVSINKEHYGGIIDSSEIWHLTEWEQQQPCCLFLLTTLFSLIKYCSSPAVPITLATTVIDYYHRIPPSQPRFSHVDYSTSRRIIIRSFQNAICIRFIYGYSHQYSDTTVLLNS